MSKDIELEKCPFCGGEVKLNPYKVEFTGKFLRKCFIHCLTDGCVLSLSKKAFDLDEENLITKWSKRTHLEAEVLRGRIDEWERVKENPKYMVDAVLRIYILKQKLKENENGRE